MAHGHGLTLDHAAWSSPWRSRSVRDKGVLSLGLLVAAVSLPPVPGGAAVALVSLVLLLGPIRVGVGVAWGASSGCRSYRSRSGWPPSRSGVSWDAGLRFEITLAGLVTAGNLTVRAIAATLAMFTLACSTPMIDLFSGAAARSRPCAAGGDRLAHLPVRVRAT